MIIGISGSIGAGKSTMLMSLCAAFKGRGLSVGGIISSRQCRNGGERSGYELLNLTEGSVLPLATLDAPAPEHAQDFFPLCHLFFYKSSLEAGNEAILKGLDADCLIIDELGFWELSGGGWSKYLHLLPQCKKPVILGVRKGIAEELHTAYGLHFSQYIEVGIHSKEAVMARLIEEVAAQNKRP